MELTTRRNCTVLGGLIFGGCTAGAIVVPIIFRSFTEKEIENLRAAISIGGVALFIAVPPAALIGLFFGSRIYRLVAGFLPFRETRWWTWLLAFALIGLWVLPFCITYTRSKRFFLEEKPPGWLAPIFYLALILLLGQGLATRSEFQIALIICPLISLFLSHCLVFNAIARYKIQDRLGPPESQNFQFSLGSLMLAVLCLGGYVTGLVLIFGK